MELTSIIQQELLKASQKFPKFSSAHEGYAVIKEELEEATDELKYLTNQLDILWMHVKENNGKQQLMAANGLIQFSERLVQEAIQVAAMCHRFKEDVCPRITQENE
jgi:predicted nuclease with TOPRIM domain